jgi:hypothetical protein
MQAERAAFALALAGVVSCAGRGNTGQRQPDPSLVLAVPWLNGVLPALDGGSPFTPAEPAYPPIALGAPDPGSRPPDCHKLDGIETSWKDDAGTAKGWVADFEPHPSDPANVGVAVAWTGFDDLTRYSFHVPGDITWYSGWTSKKGSAVWGLAAAPAGGPSCDGQPNGWSLHFRGGSFRKWGAGMSHVFTDPATCAAGDDYCSTRCSLQGGVDLGDLCSPPAPSTTVDSAGIPLTAADGNPYLQSHAFIDASKYDGLAFWARRGPEGQERMIVTVTDNFTSDRLARQNQKYCRRLRACYTQCLNGAMCSPTNDPNSATPVYRCVDPHASAFSQIASSGAPQALQDLLYPRCGPSACTSPSTYLDDDFDNKTCRPYTFPAGDVSGEYCFNEGDPPPPDRDEQCLDGWATTVGLTLDWQYYTVPFSELRQGGFGKKAPYFNLKAIDTIALGFIVGWADVYVDNVTFYRRKK